MAKNKIACEPFRITYKKVVVKGKVTTAAVQERCPLCNGTGWR